MAPSKHAAAAPPGPGFDPPDGGWRAWSQVLAAHLVTALTWGYAAAFGVYQLYYVDALGLPATQASWIGSVQVFLSFAACAAAGRLADAGHARRTVAAGCALAVAGTVATSAAAGRYWALLLAQGVCTGLGLGMAFMPAMAVASSYFGRRRPLALGVVAMGTSVGAVVFPATVQYLMPAVGFGWAVRSAAAVALALGAVACALLRPWLPLRRAGPWVEWAAFRELPYLLFALGAFLNFYAIYFGFFYINSYARDVVGFSSLDSVSLLLIANALGVPTRPLAGYLASGVLGPINVFVGATALLAAVFFAWTAVATRAAMYAYSAAFGIASSANQGTFFAALASLTEDPGKIGIRFGMVETLSSFASLAGPPTAGAIIDSCGGEYLWAQVWGGTVMALAALTYAASRVAVTGWTWGVRV